MKSSSVRIPTSFQCAVAPQSRPRVGWKLCHGLRSLIEEPRGRATHVAVLLTRTAPAGELLVVLGHVYTSAGVTAGIDLGLALIEDNLGSAIALRVAQALVVFLRRPGGQRQFSTLSSSQSADQNQIRELQAWMSEHLEENLSVEALASRAAMSARNFARVFAREVGVTPAHYVEQLRIEGARRELELGNSSLESVAESCGLHSGEVMRRAFLRRLGIAPNDYRERFMARSARSPSGGGSPLRKEP